MSGAWRPTAASTFTTRRSAGWAASITEAPTPSGRRGRVRAAAAGVVDAGAIFAAGVARALIGAAACTGVSRSDTNATATTAAAASDATIARRPRGGRRSSQPRSAGKPVRLRIGISTHR